MKSQELNMKLFKLYMVMAFAFAFTMLKPVTASAYDPHGMTGGSGAVCKDCHNIHVRNADGSIPQGLISQSLSVTGATLLASGNCVSCHYPLGPAPAVDMHQGVVADGSHYDFQMTCSTCHEMHQEVTTASYKHLRSIIHTPTNGDVTIAPISSSADFVTASGNGICQACHSGTNHYAFGGDGSADTHGQYNDGTSTSKDCLTCHKHKDPASTNLGFAPAGDCVACHTNPQPANLPDARRPVAADFIASGSHHNNRDFGQYPLEKFDCIMCHREGNRYGHMTANHKNAADEVRLRDVDDSTDTNLKWVEDKTGAINVNPDTSDLSNGLTLFCLRCHDGNGINDSAFLTALQAEDSAVSARSASDPFSDGSVLGVGSSLDANDAFDGASHYSTHNISFRWSASGATGTVVSGANPPWRGSIKTSAFINGWNTDHKTQCIDCHGPGNSGSLGIVQNFANNIHGSRNTNFLLDSSKGLDETIQPAFLIPYRDSDYTNPSVGTSINPAASNSEYNLANWSDTATCFKCHNFSVYALPTSTNVNLLTTTDVKNFMTYRSRYPYHGVQHYQHMRGLTRWSAPVTESDNGTGIVCLNCHAGGAAGSIHGSIAQQMYYDAANTATAKTPLFLNGAALSCWMGGDGRATIQCSGSAPTFDNYGGGAVSYGPDSYARLGQAGNGYHPDYPFSAGIGCNHHTYPEFTTGTAIDPSQMITYRTKNDTQARRKPANEVWIDDVTGIPEWASQTTEPAIELGTLTEGYCNSAPEVVTTTNSDGSHTTFNAWNPTAYNTSIYDAHPEIP